jgi:hypothetical protein
MAKYEIVVDNQDSIVMSSPDTDIALVGCKATHNIYMYVPIKTHDVKIASYIAIDNEIVNGNYYMYAGCIVIELQDILPITIKEARDNLLQMLKEC